MTVAAVAATAVAETTAGLIVAASQAGTRRVRKAFMGQARGKEIDRLGIMLQKADLSTQIQTAAIMNALPDGLSLAVLNRWLSGGDFQGIMHEIIALELHGAVEENRDRLVANLEAALFSRLPHVNSSELTNFCNTLLEELERLTSNVVRRLSEIAPDAAKSIKQESNDRLIQATLQRIADHSQSRSRKLSPQDQDDINAWRQRYLAAVAQAHGVIEPPDFERKRKVAIDKLYVPSSIVQRGSRRGEREGHQDLASFAKQIDRTVLLGDPGGGKSTASNYLAYQCTLGEEGPTPIIVVLREFAQASAEGQSVVEYIEARLRRVYQCPPPVDYLDSLMGTGDALIIFDGLDELIDTRLRRHITDIVELFSCRYPLAKILVTSRRVGYEQAQLDPTVFDVYELSSFNDAQVEEFVRKWFSVVEKLHEDVLESTVEAFVSETSQVRDLAQSPLLLSLMCIIYRGAGYIPKNRPDVYAKCATLLFDEWDSSRRIHVELAASSYVDPAMKHLAYWMLTVQASVEAVTEEQLTQEMTHYLEKAFEDELLRRQAAKEFVTFCRDRAWVLSDAGTTADGELLFKFTHRTFMEYFAAFEITRRADGPVQLARQLLPKVAAGQWDVVGQLAVQICNKNSHQGAERVIDRLFADRRRRSLEGRSNVVGFIARCLGFLVVPPALLRVFASRLLEVTNEAYERSLSPTYWYRRTQQPIWEILKISTESREVVAAQLKETLQAWLSSEDGPLRKTAQELIGFGFIFFSSDNAQRAGMSGVEFWYEWGRELLADNLDLVVKSSSDFGAWYSAFRWRLVTLKELLSAFARNGGAPLDGIYMERTSHLLGVGCVSISHGMMSIPEDDSLSEISINDSIEHLSVIQEAIDQALSSGNLPLVSAHNVSPIWRIHPSWPTCPENIEWALAVMRAITVEMMAIELGRLQSQDTPPRKISSRWVMLSQDHREIMESWQRGELSFVSPGEFDEESERDVGAG